MVRNPAVAGMFYPGDERGLKKELSKFISFNENKKRVIGLISPHAGYVYSGGCAGKGFSMVEIPNTVIILGVNHRGVGYSFAVDGNDSWKTPLGDASVNIELRSKLLEDSEIFRLDSIAGRDEHSLEVQVPFIQYQNPDAKILPITISSNSFKDLKTGGIEIAKLMNSNKDIMIVASSDMSHYIDAEEAKIMDDKAIEEILNLNPEGLFKTVFENRISMCGVCPVVMMLIAAIESGAKKAEIIEYTNSGKITGDFSEVVAYLSMIIY